MNVDGYETNVFLNCPFDAKYAPIFEAIVFAVHDCGYVARCALEEDDSGNVRVSKIYSIIGDCRLGIHDISRTESGGRPRLPRFNMPLELGVFLGARTFGTKRHRDKQCLILDRERYRYQRFISDIAGQDIRSHDGEPAVAVRAVRDWLNTHVRKGTILPGGAKMARRHATFQAALPALLKTEGVTRAEMTYNDYTTLLVAWLRDETSKL